MGDLANGRHEAIASNQGGMLAEFPADFDRFGPAVTTFHYKR
jgi:hypothetical protein